LNKHAIILSKFKNNEIIHLTDRAMTLSVALKCADVAHGARISHFTRDEVEESSKSFSINVTRKWNAIF